MSVHRLAQWTSLAAFVLIVAGGLVTSTGSGLAIPDWPLAYGQLVPPWVGGIRFEYAHRLIAALVALLAVMLVIGLWRTQQHRSVRWFGLFALSGIVLQAVLGGLTVLQELPRSLSIAHACVGSLVFCALASLAYVLSPSWSCPLTGHGDSRLAHLTGATTGLLLLQLFVGAIRRHTGMGLTAHLIGAGLVSVSVVWMAFRVRRQHRRDPVVTRLIVWLVTLWCWQLLLGVVSAWFWPSVFIRTAHQAGGVLLLATSVVLTIRTRHTVGRLAPWLSWRRIATYLELTKPRLTLLAVMTTLVGFLLAADGGLAVTRLVLTLLGTLSVVAGAQALNQYLEREADAKMARTNTRPLPARRLRPEQALTCGVLLAVVGLVSLAVGVNLLTSVLESLALSLYLFVYTPLKSRTALCTLVGAIPGAIPPMAGWAAARNSLDSPAWILGAILFLWQLPHFLALAWLYREDYARADFRFLTSLDPRGASASRQIVLYSIALVPVTLVPTVLGLTGAVYFVGALVLGLVFVGMGWRVALVKSARQARWLFMTSITYLPLLLTLMALDRV